MRSRKAVSILELVIILAIIGAIIAILLPRFRYATPIPAKVMVIQAPDSIIEPGATTAIAVLLTDSAGMPAKNARVTFAVSKGGGSVSPVAALTDSAGNARAAWNVGADSGAKAITIAAPDKPTSAITIATFARKRTP